MPGSSRYFLDKPVSDLGDPSTWPTRYCPRCDTTLRAPTWRRLAAMNARHHTITKGRLFTRCMSLHIDRLSEKQDRERRELGKLILKAPSQAVNGIVHYEIVGGFICGGRDPMFPGRRCPLEPGHLGDCSFNG